MGDTVVQEVQKEEIPVIGAAEESEQEGQQEKGEQQVQDLQEQQKVEGSDAQDPLLSLPLATLTPGTGESKEGGEENKEGEGEGEGEKEEEEGEEEEEEEEEEEDYGTKLKTFYTTRSQYFRGTQPNLLRKFKILLNQNNKDANKLVLREGSLTKTDPLHGDYFILAKNKLKKKKKVEGEEGEEGEEKEEEEEEEEEGKNITTLLFLPETAKYTTTGDLQEIKGSKETKVELPIEIPNYRPLTTDELFANLEHPDKAIRLAQEQYNKAHASMRLALKEKDHPNLKNRMNALYSADLKLLNARFAARAVYFEEKVDTNTILFDRSKDTSKIASIGRFIGSKIPITRRYVTDKPPPAEQALKGGAGSAHVIVINMPDGDNGILSPFFQIPFTIEGIVYSCVYKAILCLLVSELGQTKEHYIREMSSYDNPQDLKEYDPLIREGQDEKIIEGHLATLIAEIYRVALQQNPLMANTLKATGDALLVVVPLERPMDSFLGVGIDPNQTDLIKNPIKWKGRNIYGNVLMDLRKELPDVQIPQEPPVVIEQIQGQEQQEQQVSEGSIPLDEEIGEEEVPEIVLQENEMTPV